MDLDCDGSRCHSECELRHLDDREQQVRGHCEPRLIICAGPERSGSTWLYNATRILHKEAQVPCDSYWMHTLIGDEIDRRLKEQRVVVCKTHKWHGSYEQLLELCKPTVLITHRNLHGVLNSYRRLGWAYSLDESYVRDHLMWKPSCSLDLAFEDFTRGPTSCLAKLADVLGIEMSSEQLGQAALELGSLRSPEWSVCQVTKLWPRHISSAGLRGKDTKSGSLCLESEHFATYMHSYGYKQ